jgi:hypothetical protein
VFEVSPHLDVRPTGPCLLGVRSSREKPKDPRSVRGATG